jgi:hypothetical protein
MRSNLLKLVGTVTIGLFMLGAVGACDDKPAAKPATTKPAATSKPKATVAATATAGADTKTAAAGGEGAEKAAEQLWAHYEKLAKLIDEHGKDCKKLGEELKKYGEADKTAEAMKKIAEDGGGKPLVEQAMEKKYGDKYEEVSDKILEATEIDCAKDANVKAAAKLMDL